MGLRANPTQRQLRLGSELRKQRERHGMHATEAGRRAGLSGPHLNHIEAGRTAIPEAKLRALLTAYGCRNETYAESLVGMSEATGRGWWSGFRNDVDPRGRDLAELESTAVSFKTFEPVHVPGLLQTPEYVQALLEATNANRPEGVIKRFHEFRLQRQEVLASENPPRLHAIVHEAAFHMGYVDAAIMRDQLIHLIEVSRLPHITIQIVPFKSASLPVVGTPFVICGGPDPELDTVYMEYDAGSAFFSDDEHRDRYAAIFDRLSSVALAPIAPERERESYAQRDSLSLVQHLLYTL